MQVVETSRRLCAELAPNSLALIEAFGLPEEMLQSPIASDWVENVNYFNSICSSHQVGYNAYDNQGELQSNDEFQEVLHNTKPDLSMGYSS